ncbi:hypothetical protein B0H34DRAFT_694723 [Crassisporium funariophilum]|nr:hypothetical protein B0H34DRAFT_694723 [Crassisporium funariophilum]
MSVTCGDYLLRAAMDPSHYPKIDSALKDLKLCTRQLLSVLNIHETELQLLQRLYYKNKNQHRGSLFWRNVVEIRRYSERVDNLDLYAKLNAFRHTFHGLDQQHANLKGPWSHFPDMKCISAISTQVKSSLKLLEKMSERCMNAFKSFHRSMQSAAFLQILLVFIAIASRLRVLSLELREVLKQIALSLDQLIGVIPNASNKQALVSYETQMHELGDGTPRHISLIPVTFDSELRFKPQRPPSTSSQVEMLESPASIDFNRADVSTKMLYDSAQSKVSQLPTQTQKKKKRKTLKNEIDDIFGF